MTNTINAIIVEDEPSAVETLEGMLRTFCPQVNVQARAHTVEEGLLAIREHDPDLVFLDIELPPMGKGFDILRLTPQRRFGVIFTTAYPQYAIQAINDAQPWGYLVKPWRVADLVQAIQVAEQKNSDAHNAKASHAHDPGIIISDQRKGNIVLLAKDIVYCEADSGLTHIYVLRNHQIERISATRSLKDLEDQLPELDFCRTHHKYLVNLQHIIRYQRTGRNGVIYLPFQVKIDISVQKMEIFEAQFKRRLKGN